MLGIFDRNFVETAARAFGLGISHQQKTVRHYRRSTSPGTEAVLFFFAWRVWSWRDKTHTAIVSGAVPGCGVGASGSSGEKVA